MTTTTTAAVPRVWIGRLVCYNTGHLVGEWFDAVGADEVTLTDVHKGSGCLSGDCEELWVMDHESIPVRGEFGLLEAARWGRCFGEVGAERWPAVCAWVESGCHVVEANGPTPSLSDFEERYAGRWDSFREYAEQLADDTGLQQGWPEEATTYFDWEGWTRDLAYDHMVCKAPGPEYGVYVFRNL